MFSSAHRLHSIGVLLQRDFSVFLIPMQNKIIPIIICIGNPIISSFLCTISSYLCIGNPIITSYLCIFPLYSMFPSITSIFHQLFINFTPTFHQLFINFSSTLHFFLPKRHQGYACFVVHIDHTIVYPAISDIGNVLSCKFAPCFQDKSVLPVLFKENFRCIIILSI